jgi:DNA polymerase III alpha subunit
MFKVMEFYNEQKQGIKPILGMEAYMASGRSAGSLDADGERGEAAHHLLPLAENPRVIRT